MIAEDTVEDIGRDTYINVTSRRPLVVVRESESL
jgi:hypothetical protein